MHGQSNAIDNQLLSDYLCVLSQLQSVYLSLSFLCFAYLAAAAQKKHIFNSHLLPVPEHAG